MNNEQSKKLEFMAVYIHFKGAVQVELHRVEYVLYEDGKITFYTTNKKEHTYELKHIKKWEMN